MVTRRSQSAELLQAEATDEMDAVEEMETDKEELGIEDEEGFREMIEQFFEKRNMEYKAPTFYGRKVNLLKLWNEVSSLGGYEKVTQNKLWRDVGGAFDPPQTCTSVSYTFRRIYERALLEYEKTQQSDYVPPPPAPPAPAKNGKNGKIKGNYTVESGNELKAKLRSTAQPPIEEPRANPPVKRTARTVLGQELELLDSIEIKDDGPPAEWIKVKIYRTSEGFEIYALVPGMSSDRIWVQCHEHGRLRISGIPELRNNPWDVTEFSKVIDLPSKIDALNTSATVSLYGQLFVHVPIASPC